MIKNRNGEIVVTNEKQNILLKKLYGTVCGRVILKGAYSSGGLKGGRSFYGLTAFRSAYKTLYKVERH